MDSNPSVSTITAKDIKDKNAQNVAQAIRMTPGVMMSEATGGRGEPSVNIRGFGYTQIGLFLDGIPVMSIYDRQTDFGQFVTQGISTIQISKGFTSPVYGMSTLGGAVNLVSKRPEKELEFSLNTRYLTGDETHSGVSIGTNQGWYYLQVDYAYTDRLTYPLSKRYEGTVAQPKGDRLNAYYTNQTIKLKAGIVPNENHEYSLNYIHQDGSKGGLWSSNGSQWWEWPHYDKDTIYLLGNSYFTPRLSLNTRLYYDTFYNQLKAWRNGVTLPTRPTGTPNFSDSIYDDDTWGGILTLGYDATDNINIKFGANVKRDHHFEKTATTGIKDTELSEVSTSVFAQYAQRIPLGDMALRFVLAGSYDRLDTLDVYVTRNNQVNDTKTKIKGDFSLQGALYFDISEAQNIYISAGKKENLPTLKQRYSSRWGQYAVNADLQPESAINSELGYNLNFNNTKFSVAGFYTYLTDMFVTENVYDTSLCNTPLSGAYCYRNINADTGYLLGGEVSVEQALLENEALVVGVNYSYIYKKAWGLDSDNTDAGRKITDYPNHIFNAKVAIKPSEKLEFIGFGTYESARYYDNGAVYEKNRDYFTLDLTANYALSRGLNLTAGVLNFTDRDNFIGAASSSNASHLAGRRFIVGFDYNY